MKTERLREIRLAWRRLPDVDGTVAFAVPEHHVAWMQVLELADEVQRLEGEILIAVGLLRAQFPDLALAGLEKALDK